MKSLYESILDDEDILIDDIKKSTNWENVVYNILVRNASSSNRGAMQEVCIEWLNEHVKISNNLLNLEYLLCFKFIIILPLSKKNLYSFGPA